MDSRANPRLQLFVAVTLLLSLVSLAITLVESPPRWSLLLIALTLVAVLSEVLSVEFGSMSISITYSICAAAMILFGPAAGGLVTGLSTIPVSFMLRERRLLRGSFNFAQLTLSGLAGAWAYVLVGGRLLHDSPFTSYEMPRALAPVLLLALVSFLVNTTLVGLAFSLMTGSSFAKVWRTTFGWSIPTQAALTVLALALAQVVASQGVIGLGLFVVPLLVARQFYARYVLLKQAYADTVRSLVAVIETKDPYTRGHSERVAAYAVDVARRLGFAPQLLDRIELAALLHDLGKVAISKSVLLKESALSDDEYEAIKTHPEIGARIIEEVPFLSDLAPFVAGHHERVDGTGYSRQLAGDAIPAEARILAVADAFDAMTSSRPYRSAMTADESVRELRRCVNRQFDPMVVEAFAEAYASGAFLDLIAECEANDEAV